MPKKHNKWVALIIHNVIVVAIERVMYYPWYLCYWLKRKVDNVRRFGKKIDRYWSNYMYEKELGGL